MSILYQNGKFINIIGNKLRQLENKINNAGSSTSIQNHETSDTIFALTPNILHIWDEVTELTLTLEAKTPGIVNEYLIQFTSGATPTILTLPKDIKWATPLKISKNKIYQISIVNNLATFAEFDALNIPQITLNLTESDIQEASGALQIINPDMISQLQTLCSWIVANEHTGEDIDNKIGELGEPLPSEMLNTVPGVVYDEGFLIIKFPPEQGLSELVYGFGMKMSAMDPTAPESMYMLVPNDIMNAPILAMLDLNTGGLIMRMGM